MFVQKLKSILRPLKSVLRPVRHALLSNEKIENKLDSILSRHEAILVSLSEKVDSLLIKAKSDTQRQDLIREIDRLDGYVGYHVDKLRELIEMKSSILNLSSDAILDLIERNSSVLHSSADAIVDLIERKSSVLYSSSDVDAIIKTGDFDLVVPSREVGLITYLTRLGPRSIEPAVRAALRRHIKTGDTVVDGGTNIGAHSVEMAYAVGERGRFFGFEALPHLAEAVRKTLGLNGLSKQSKVVQAALSDQKGDLTFYAADHSPISSLFELDGNRATSTSVRSVTLDDEIAPDLRVDLVKLDIEGAEPLAWQGMSRIVTQNHDLVVVMEWSASHFHRSGKDPSVFMTQILGSGFSGWRLIDDALDQPVRICLEQAASLEETNLLFSRNSELY